MSAVFAVSCRSCSEDLRAVALRFFEISNIGLEANA